MTNRPVGALVGCVTVAIRITRPVLRLTRENAFRRQGHRCIAGLDEVGRGPLAGPVVAAAVVLDLKNVPTGLADSKVLTAAQREELFEEILATAQSASPRSRTTEIDIINIRQASLLAMCRALAALPCVPDMALVDGNDPPPLPCPVEAIVKGDATIASIAAASIVAKVVRDRLMKRLGATLSPPMALAPMPATARPFASLGARERGALPVPPQSFSPLRQGVLDL